MESHSASDRAFCRAILPEVSRTFALSIEALPDGLQEPVRTAYLLCRMVDTVEDATEVTPNQRELLFDAFEALVSGGLKQATLFAKAAEEIGVAEGTAEGRLCAAAERVARTFQGLTLEQQETIRPSVLEMTRGMRATSARADAAGELRLASLEDLERYCYFVAGTVGELLTGLFESAVGGLDETARTSLRERAVSFGTGLQLVNILKDVPEDWARGVCYVPVEVAEAEGLVLAEMFEDREAGMRVVRRLAGVARGHLARAVEYTLLWPVTDAHALAVRRFCAVPLALALATLAVVESGRDVLVPGRTPKVDRLTVARIIAEAQSVWANDQALADLFGRSGAQDNSGS